MGLFDRRHEQLDEEGNVLPTHATSHSGHTVDPRRSSATYPVDYEPGATHSHGRDGIGLPVGRTTGTESVGAGMHDNQVREKPNRTKGGGIRGILHNLTFRDGDPYGRRPTFVEWWRMYWHDFLVFFLEGMLSLALLKWSPVPTGKFFTVTVGPPTAGSSSQFSEVYEPTFAYPKMSQHIPIIADAVIAVAVPITFILIMQFRVRSFWDVNNGIWGVLYAVMTGCMIQIIVKLVYAGLRPNFLTVCQPKIPVEDLVRLGQGFQDIYFNARICSNPDKKMVANSLQSFPSGHSTAAFAGLVFASLYINGKLKIFGNTHPPYFFLILFLFPLTLATCVVGTLMLDMSHNWYDILAGSLLGTFTAFVAYRATYASVWDYRTNHIPTPRVLGRKNGWKTGLRSADHHEVGAFSKMQYLRHGGWGQKGQAWV